jgi:hypothetical protein
MAVRVTILCLAVTAQTSSMVATATTHWMQVTTGAVILWTVVLVTTPSMVAPVMTK